jgi:hypothetical protein
MEVKLKQRLVKYSTKPCLFDSIYSFFLFFFLALIENISAIPDVSANASGLPNVSLLIQTSHRQLKLTAPTMEKHDLWFEVRYQDV